MIGEKKGSAGGWAARIEEAVEGRYRLVSVMKQKPGELAVACAMDDRTGELVKIKWRPAGASDRWERREVEVLAVIDHPRVPRTREVIATAAGTAYVQTFFEGPTPRELMRRLGQLDRAAVIAVAASTLEILAHLHVQAPPIVHRDLKPSNMVCLPTGEIALIDFGIARAGMRDKLSEPVHELTQAHTVGYAPPEQMIGLEASPAADLYALGASAMYLLTGTHPVRLWDALQGRLRLPADVEPTLAAFLAWLTEPAVAERCPSAEAALTALAHLPDPGRPGG